MSFKPMPCSSWPLRLPTDIRSLETNPYTYQEHHCILLGVRHTVQVLVLDPLVQRLSGVLGPGTDLGMGYWQINGMREGRR
jgi:hypothetical protein